MTLWLLYSTLLQRGNLSQSVKMREIYFKKASDVKLLLYGRGSFTA